MWLQQQKKSVFHKFLCTITDTGDKGVEPLTGPSPFAASIAQATAALTAMATAGKEL